MFSELRGLKKKTLPKRQAGIKVESCTVFFSFQDKLGGGFKYSLGSGDFPGRVRLAMQTS